MALIDIWKDIFLVMSAAACVAICFAVRSIYLYLTCNPAMDVDKLNESDWNAIMLHIAHDVEYVSQGISEQAMQIRASRQASLWRRGLSLDTKAVINGIVIRVGSGGASYPYLRLSRKDAVALCGIPGLLWPGILSVNFDRQEVLLDVVGFLAQYANGAARRTVTSEVSDLLYAFTLRKEPRQGMSFDARRSRLMKPVQAQGAGA